MVCVLEVCKQKVVLVDLVGKKYVVVFGYVIFVNDGQKYWIGFGVFIWLYGVKLLECIWIDDEVEYGWDDELWFCLIWLYLQRWYEEYEFMKEELVWGEDVFKLIEF